MTAWDDFDIVEASAADDGWTPLPPNGWGALVAYAAGPQHARGVRRPQRPVKEVAGATGETRSRPPTDDELGDMREHLEGYLSMSGIPAPPDGVEWQIRLPGGMDERRLDREVNGAMYAADDMDFPGQRAAVERHLAVLFGSAS